MEGQKFIITVGSRSGKADAIRQDFYQKNLTMKIRWAIERDDHDFMPCQNSAPFGSINIAFGGIDVTCEKSMFQLCSDVADKLVDLIGLERVQVLRLEFREHPFVACGVMQLFCPSHRASEFHSLLPNPGTNGMVEYDNASDFRQEFYHTGIIDEINRAIDAPEDRQPVGYFNRNNPEKEPYILKLTDEEE